MPSPSRGCALSFPDAPAEDAAKCPTVFLHVVGTGAESDRPLIGCGITPCIPIADHQQAGVSFSTASRYALGWVMVDRARTALDFYTAPVDRLSAPDVPWRRLASGDDQVTEVVLRHVGKLVARLQAATANGKPVLLPVNWTGGHSVGGLPPADRYSFMLCQMGIAEFQPASDK